jgi:predicted metal-binding membrane protein
MLPARDRAAILAALGGLTALAWIYLRHEATRMGAMAGGGMSGMSGMPGMADMPGMLELHAWSATDAALMLLMWVVMMAGMMVPSAAPATLLYAAVARKARAQGSTVAPTALFVVGYLMAWAGFSVAATAAQWGLDRAALLSPAMVASSPALGAGLLIAAGLYQLTPFKAACLRHCRGPVHFLSAHWRDGIGGALRMGFRHGLYCLGCCWALMLLLFLGGVMNLIWIAAIALFVLIEKLLPGGDIGGRVAGVAMIAAGVVMLGRAL